MAEKKSVFETLNAINVNEKTEKKNGLTYLSWAWAWGEIKKLYPNATYTIYERETQYGAVNYFTDGMTCWVKTGVTIEGLEHIEELPVMDFRNSSIRLEKVTSFDVNKAIQRSLTKACARHGLGLYIYAGEDLPEEEQEMKQSKPKSTKKVAEKPVDPLVEEIGQFYSTHKGFGQVIKSVLQQEGVGSVGELPQDVLQHLVDLARKSANSFQ